MSDVLVALKNINIASYCTLVPTLVLWWYLLYKIIATKSDMYTLIGICVLMIVS